MSESQKRVRMLVEGALLVAVAQALSYLKLWEMPWGGSICVGMLPIFLYSVRWGVGPGLMAGFVYGTLQFMFDGGFALGWQSILGDYLVAFTVLGLAGVCAGKKGGIFTGTLVGSLARFLVHYVVGATVWAEYMPEVFFGMTMTTPWFYSFLYNITWAGPDILLTILIFVIFYQLKPMRRFLERQDLA